MAYNSIISRTNAQAMIPEVVSMAMMEDLVYESAALTLMKRIPVSTNQTRLPILAALPTAGFVNGDTGLKATTQMAWANKYLNIEELAAIVPIPEAVLDDASFDVWGSIKPLLVQGIGRALDSAVLFGVNKPASWPTDINTAAIAAGNTRVRGTASQSAGGVAEDFNQLFAKVEADGFAVDGLVARTSYKSILRGARDTTGQALLDVANQKVMGEDLKIVAAGLWPTGGGAGTNAEAFAGEWSQAILGVRQDITYKILTEAVIQDGSGTIQFNLAQQDMVALRVVFRVGWQVANTINYEGANDSTQYPFAVMRF